MSDPFKTFIKPLMATKPIDAPEPDVFIAELAEDLQQYPDDTLKAAFKWLRKNYKFKFFPTNAVCIDACEAQERRVKRTVVPQTKHNPLWTRARVSWADSAIQSELGREAAANGWIGALWDFYREEMREPGPAEILRLQRKTAETDRLLFGSNIPPQARIAREAIMRRREEKAALAMGGTP